jgi:hypothetical protein
LRVREAAGLNNQQSFIKVKWGNGVTSSIVKFPASNHLIMIRYMDATVKQSNKKGEGVWH